MTLFNYKKYKIIKHDFYNSSKFQSVIMAISLLKKHDDNIALSKENIDTYIFYNEVISIFTEKELEFLQKNNLSYFDIFDTESNILTYIKDNEKDIKEEDFFKHKEMIKEIIKNQAAFAQATENETLSHFCLSLIQIIENKKSSNININEDLSHLLNSKETIRF